MSNHNNKIYALTGSIASGKTTATNIFKELGAKVIDADEIARGITNKEDIKSRIRDSFGDQVFTNNQINRSKLAEIVFSNLDEKKILEDIIHPEVRKEFKVQLDQLLKLKDNSIIIYSIPLLYETKADLNQFNGIILISSNKENCINRIISRDNISKELANKKYNSQMDIKEKEKLSDYIIFNNTDISSLKREIKELYPKLR